MPPTTAPLDSTTRLHSRHQSDLICSSGWRNWLGGGSSYCWQQKPVKMENVVITWTRNENLVRVISVYRTVPPCPEASKCGGHAPRGICKFQCDICNLSTSSSVDKRSLFPALAQWRVRVQIAMSRHFALQSRERLKLHKVSHSLCTWLWKHIENANVENTLACKQEMGGCPVLEMDMWNIIREELVFVKDTCNQPTKQYYTLHIDDMRWIQLGWKPL